jgi:hypothetical protein
MITIRQVVPILSRDGASVVRSRVPVLAVAVLAAAASACGAEVAPEELFATPIARDVPAGDPGSAVPEAGPSEVLSLEAASATEADPEETDPATDAEPAEPHEDVGTEADGTDASAVASADDDAGTAARPQRPPTERSPQRPAASGPSDSDIARFVAERTRAAVDSDHHAADVTGDGVRDVIVGVRSLEGEVALILGTWDGTEILEVGRTAHPASTGLGSLLVRDLDGDGRPELLLPYLDRPHRGVLVATVSATGQLVTPASCPTPEPGPQVLDFGAGTEAVVLACEPRDARGHDGLVWADGVFAGAAAGGPRSRD